MRELVACPQAATLVAIRVLLGQPKVLSYTMYNRVLLITNKDTPARSSRGGQAAGRNVRIFVQSEGFCDILLLWQNNK
jgi:hypothetical protein